MIGATHASAILGSPNARAAHSSIAPTSHSMRLGATNYVGLLRKRRERALTGGKERPESLALAAQPAVESLKRDLSTILPIERTVALA